MFGIDAVLLAHFAHDKIKKSESVIDLCTGTAIVPLLLEKCVPDSSRGSVQFSALELQKKYAELANRSVELNGLSDKIKVIEGDVKNIESLFAKHSFNIVTCNPPYMNCEQGKVNPCDEKAIARHEIFCTLDDVVKAADFLLHTHGKFFMIHKAERLPEIFVTLKKYSLEPKVMQLVQPYKDENANLVLIEARKNAKKGLLVLPPLVVRQSEGEQKGEYTSAINEIYKRMSEARR